MSVNLRTIAAVWTLAIFGLFVHHVKHDANATHPGVMATRATEIAKTGSGSDVSGKATSSSGESESDNFQTLKDQLRSAQASAASLPGYTAILEMQEEVDGTLRPVDRVEFKIRRQPFSVYMRWNDSGQEVLYVDGENDNRLLVKPTNGLATLRRVWRLEPDSRVAKQNCRYPITDAGIENLVRRIQEFYSQRHDWSALADCELSESTLAGRPVTVFEVRFTDKDAIPEYCRSRICFDKQSDLLTALDNYGWSSDGEPRLIEHYVYEQIGELPLPADREFTESNPAYQFTER